MLIASQPLVEITATVNGVQRSAMVATNVVLADFLRAQLGLKGCKIACDAAVCGACTVLVDGRPMAACSMFAFEIEGADVLTIEGLGGAAGPDPVQQAFLACDSFQCGYCTPGMILSVKALLARIPDPDETAIREWLGANLCRCTGYEMIIDAVKAASASLKSPR